MFRGRSPSGGREALAKEDLDHFCDIPWSGQRIQNLTQGKLLYGGLDLVPPLHDPDS